MMQFSYNAPHAGAVGALIGAPIAAVWPTQELAGEDRLRGGFASKINARITGVDAHAAVRTHVSPVTQGFGYCPKFETTRFQRWKVAT